MINVRRAKNWKGDPGYEWVCSEHVRHRGFHHFNRFTDRIRRHARYRHPWERAMTSAICHYHKFHRPHRRVIT